MNTRHKFNEEHAAALAALNHNGILDAALEALKETLMRDIVLTDVHESKKREEC